MRITEGLVKISVRELVEFVMRQGSITGRVASPNRAVIGTLAHKKLQKSMGPDYEAEVKLVHEYTIEDVVFVVEGRADGIIKDLVSVTIDEIKTTATPLVVIDENFNPLHWAQAKCYAYFYAKAHQLAEIQVRLTYYHIETKEIKHLQRGFFLEELEGFFKQLMARYYKWIRYYMDWTALRDDSLRQLTFPFATYRKGQREVAVSVYKTIQKEATLFVNAPTGIGKTISTLFPALKAIGEGAGSKVFYLTAKTITRTVAEEGVVRLIQQGARIKTITLTAKDKICFCEKRQCHPDFCRFAEGHYDRVDDVVYEMLQKEDLFTRQVIEMYAKRYQLCPFELALDVATWADVVICDYNYVFDPNVALKRFVDYSETILLVDEAHNLVDRAREMYSAGLSKRQVLSVKKALGKSHRGISKELTKLNEHLLGIKRDYIEDLGVYITKEPPQVFFHLLRRFLGECDKWLVKPGEDLPNELMDLYFEVYQFTRCYELFDEHYIYYGEQRGSEVYVKQFCLDPSYPISEVIKGCKSAIFFSATLLPIDYFKEMLGGQEEMAINFDSPFEPSHARRLMALDVSTRYKDRGESVSQICRYIEGMLQAKKGHYMVFFPSYKYMQDVYEYLIRRHTQVADEMTLGMAIEDEEESLIREVEESLGCRLYKQAGEMSEEEREAFLAHFGVEGEGSISFCVLGGIFSEGIDLTGDQLIGVMVVGVGLPQIGLERDLIKHYFDEAGKDGYHYAYTYPGINKVLQAVGRLIRTESDKGVIILVDDRYQSSLYQGLLPHAYEKIRSSGQVGEKIRTFWNGWSE